jgi:hypothetical protein
MFIYLIFAKSRPKRSKCSGFFGGNKMKNGMLLTVLAATLKATV